MTENSGVAESHVSVVDANVLSDEEVRLIAMFRSISLQRQMDVLRLLEVFSKVFEQHPPSWNVLGKLKQ